MSQMNLRKKDCLGFLEMTDDKKVEYDTRQLTAIRLDKELQSANHFSSELNHEEWMRALINVWKECECKFKPDEKKKAMECRVKIREKNNKIAIISRNGQEGRGIGQHIGELLVMLENWELLLRRYADSHGLLNPTKGDMWGDE
jgi:hypothetical protein